MLLSFVSTHPADLVNQVQNTALAFFRRGEASRSPMHWLRFLWQVLLPFHKWVRSHLSTSESPDTPATWPIQFARPQLQTCHLAWIWPGLSYYFIYLETKKPNKKILSTCLINKQCLLFPLFFLQYMENNRKKERRRRKVGSNWIEKRPTEKK